MIGFNIELISPHRKLKSIFKKWILHKWLQNLLKSVYFLPKLTYGLIFFCLISGLSRFWMLIKIAKYLWILGKIWKPLMILVAPNHPNLYNYMHYRAWSSNTIKALGMHFYREKFHRLHMDISLRMVVEVIKKQFKDIIPFLVDSNCFFKIWRVISDLEKNELPAIDFRNGTFSISF